MLGEARIDGEISFDDLRVRVSETPEHPVTLPGDLWLLGPHRLLCCDATAAIDVARLLDGVRPQLMVSDPPYGNDYDPAWRNNLGAAATRRTGEVLNDHRASWRVLAGGMDVLPRRHRMRLARRAARRERDRELEAAGFAICGAISGPCAALGAPDYVCSEVWRPGKRIPLKEQAVVYRTAHPSTCWRSCARDRMSGFRVLQLMPGIGATTAEGSLDRVETMAGAASLAKVRVPPGAASTGRPSCRCSCSCRAAPLASRPRSRRRRLWYDMSQHLERRYEDTAVRAGDLVQLVRIAERSRAGTHIPARRCDQAALGFLFSFSAGGVGAGLRPRPIRLASVWRCAE